MKSVLESTSKLKRFRKRFEKRTAFTRKHDTTVLGMAVSMCTVLGALVCNSIWQSHLRNESRHERFAYFEKNKLYVIKFVSDLRQVGGFLRVLRCPQPIKLTGTN